MLVEVHLEIISFVLSVHWWCGGELNNRIYKAVVQMVVALWCKPKGGGFDSRWGHRDFSLT
jgi:hypothetical protein